MTELALDSALGLRRDLPRERHAVARARSLVRAWNRAHAEAAATLVVDAPPGSVRVDYDLLLELRGVGTAALSWREDRGMPWSVCYADHWAANFVVTVDDDQRLTVQQALLLLRMAGETRPELATAMVDHLLFQQLAERDDTLAVDDLELQEAGDRFRRELGLLTAEATRAWMEEHRMTEEALAAMLELRVRIGKAKDRLVEQRLAGWLEQHRGELDRAQVIAVTIEDPAARAAAREAGLAAALATLGPRDSASITTRLVGELPAAVRSALPGEIVADGDVLYQLRDRQRGELDAPALAHARRAICDAWAAERRAQVQVRWHWW